MKLASLFLLVLTLTASAQSTQPSAPQFTDPANLRGERVQPRDGRELPIDQGAKGLEQLLRKLNTRASVMNIVAHPDDEDGGMLTLYSRGLGARVADLSLNRGEGGQNAMTADFEDALGLLRTQELLASDRYTGVDQFFGTEVDFGFSKTKEEAFAKWTHDRVLFDVVRAIRLYRPLVLTSTWIGGVTDGHGQHQVSGQIAQEAFLAAGDPKVFPELAAEGILPWQPLRIYARVPRQAITDKGLYDYATNQYVPASFTNYVTGEVTTTVPSTDVVVHEGTPDPLLTTGAPGDTHGITHTYIQFARLGLAQQKSQIGPDFHPAPTGAYDVPYHLYGSKLPTQMLSSRPEAAHFAAAAERPLYFPAAAIPSGSSNNQVPQGFSLGSHRPRKDVGFSPEGMPSDATPNFFTGIDTSITGIATLAPQNSILKSALTPIAGLIEQATKSFDPAKPETIALTLTEALKQTDALITSVTADKSLTPLESASVLHELRIKRVQLNDALALSLGVTYSITAFTGAPANATLVSVLLDGHIATKTNIESAAKSPITFLGPKGMMQTGPPTGFHEQKIKKQYEQNIDLLVQGDAATKPWTRPYFTRPDIEQPFYDLSVPALRNAPEGLPYLNELGVFRYGDTQFAIGTKIRPAIAVSPPVSVRLSSSATVLPLSARSLSLTVHVESGSPSTTKGDLRLELPAGWTSEPGTVPLAFKKADETRDIAFTITPGTLQSKTSYALNAVAEFGSTEYRQGFRAVGYPGLQYTNYYTPAETRIVPVDLKFPTHHHIAYLPGTGDSVPEALASIGLTATMLTVADLAADKLKLYDTVILGVRTYAAHPDLHGAPTQALLDYARNGGNVVVQYQTTEFTAADAPYPLSLGSNEKVVDETAPVTLTAQNSETQNSKLDRILTTPNLLTPADFNNWVEERGHGFLSTWDDHYTALTETHDPGQSPQRGGLITTPFGKGHWTYVAFALYRQLPEAVPGAFRLFANLLNP
jgi:LmbE family N-acetylglucosaminyl deacetylase